MFVSCVEVFLKAESFVNRCVLDINRRSSNIVDYFLMSFSLRSMILLVDMPDILALYSLVDTQSAKIKMFYDAVRYSTIF